ncbi:hypothetical protein HQ393_10570 [Chitinibacter bivalviorum]|uniref:Uncharacterized protein n=1 Tax=Chitinibacter bivalviorum TaxID=2739434 RepID=A0A7H9BJ16_9NEIS|nr:hypothetical protein [Chitinibacter bivalviorum]QLG88647.1 hypothetical protein HQ393_10570 [Chitinibacter bivalviorum]
MTTISASKLDPLLEALQSVDALTSYQAASTLEVLKLDMSDEQRAQFEAALASASHRRYESNQANEKLEAEKEDDWGIPAKG